MKSEKSLFRNVMSQIESYRDLIVWQKGMELAKQVYIFTARFPKAELFGIGQQLRRAAISIPSNIAEGNGRGSKQDYVRFLFIARGSLFEAQTQIELCRELGLFKPDQSQPLSLLAIEIEKMLNTIISRMS